MCEVCGEEVLVGHHPVEQLVYCRNGRRLGRPDPSEQEKGTRSSFWSRLAKHVSGPVQTNGLALWKHRADTSR